MSKHSHSHFIFPFWVVTVVRCEHRRFFPPIFRGALEECTAESRAFAPLLQLIILNSPKIDLKRCTTFVETVHCFHTSQNFGGAEAPPAP